jgi:hypothetical protein
VRVDADKGAMNATANAFVFQFVEHATIKLSMLLTPDCLGSDCASLDQTCTAKNKCGSLTVPPAGGGGADAGPDLAQPPAHDWAVFNGNLGGALTSVSGFGGIVLVGKTSGEVEESTDGGHNFFGMGTGLPAVTSIWAQAADEWWAVGNDAKLAHYKSTWSADLPFPTDTDLWRGVFGTTTRIFLVGLGGAVQSGPLPRTAMNDWVEVKPVNADLKAVWASGMKVYVVGTGIVLMSSADGTTGWSNASPPMLSGNANAVWGVSADEVWVVDDGGQVHHTKDGAMTWTTDVLETGALRAVWASAANDVYAAGASGTIHHFSTTWANEKTETGEAINALWGADAAHVYAGGERSFLGRK